VNKTEYIGKLNALYVGEKNCLEELITIYDEKDKEIERLNNIIKEAIEYIKKHRDYNKSSGCIEELDLYKINELLEILEGE
jgi:hypothetical protein